MASDRVQWLKDRQKGIGGSDAAAAVGLSKWKTPFQLWMEKTTDIRYDDESVATEEMRWGNRLEPVIRQAYQDITGLQVEQTATMFVHPKHEFAFANLDGLIRRQRGFEDRVLECKTARTAEGWGTEGTDEIPSEYLMQVQHYLGVTGLGLCDVAVLIGGSDFRIYAVEANQELQDELFEQEAEFWDCVQRRDPPAPSNSDDIKLRWAQSINRDLIDASPDDLTLWEKLVELRDQLKKAEERKEVIENTLKLRITDKGGLQFAGKPLVTWRSNKSSRAFDLQRFKDEQPDLHREYTVERKGARPFLVKTPKL